MIETNKIKKLISDDLIKKATENRCEITVEITPENIEIKVSPWEPFAYNCPYGKEEKKNED